MQGGGQLQVGQGLEEAAFQAAAKSAPGQVLQAAGSLAEGEEGPEEPRVLLQTGKRGFVRTGKATPARGGAPAPTPTHLHQLFWDSLLPGLGDGHSDVAVEQGLHRARGTAAVAQHLWGGGGRREGVLSAGCLPRARMPWKGPRMKVTLKAGEERRIACLSFAFPGYLRAGPPPPPPPWQAAACPVRLVPRACRSPRNLF